MSAIKLTASAERKAVLVPCYGFTTHDAARPYLETLAGRPYLPFAQCGRRRLYVPNTPSWTTSCEVNDFLDLEPHRPAWNRLRAADMPMPADAYNVALVVNGPRQFYHHVSRSSRMPLWQQRMSEGWRDCYVTWNCVEEKRHAFYDMATDKSLYLVRSARGVIYAVAPTYDSSGNLDQIRRLVVCVEFRILDKQPEKGDVMRVAASRRNYYDDPGDNGGRISDDYDPGWRALVERAKRGYDQHCQLLPTKEEDWRSWFIDQSAQAAADAEHFGASFGERVKQLDWQEALDLAEEAWQLELVIRHHAGQTQFYQSAMYPGSRGTQAGNMIQAYYESSTERANRKEEIGQMLADFVVLRDRLWSYVGD
jgi:hypothetical protein